MKLMFFRERCTTRGHILNGDEGLESVFYKLFIESFPFLMSAAGSQLPPFFVCFKIFLFFS